MGEEKFYISLYTYSIWILIPAISYLLAWLFPTGRRRTTLSKYLYRLLFAGIISCSICLSYLLVFDPLIERFDINKGQSIFRVLQGETMLLIPPSYLVAIISFFCLVHASNRERWRSTPVT
jgi:hypothetical protein